MSVEDSESRRFELNIWLGFSQAVLGPRSAQEFLSRVFLESLEPFFFFNIWAHSDPHISRTAGIFEVQTFFWQHRVSFHRHRSKRPKCVSYE